MIAPTHAPVLATLQRGLMPHGRMLLVFLLPLFFSSMLNMVLDLTDTWFIAQIAPEATAGQGAVYFAMVALFLGTGGVGMAVQPLVAQAMGARMRGRAIRVLWTGLLYSAASFLLFLLWLQFMPLWVAKLGLTPVLQDYALAYLEPRLLGGPLVVAFWAVMGFFNGTGRTLQSLKLMGLVALLNVALNWLFTHHFTMGVAGTAWATNCALLFGVVLGVLRLLFAPSLRGFRAWRLLRIRRMPVAPLVAMGLPLGAWAMAEVLSWAVFQATQSRVGVVDGATTHLVIMLTSFAYWPALGLGMGNSTLVGQALGAGYPKLAMRLGNRVLRAMLIYTGSTGLLIALAGPWLLPHFIAPDSPHYDAMLSLGCMLLWLAASYQLFDALNIGSSFALRGAGDVLRPSLYLILLAWGFFLPLLQAFTFGPGEGFIPALGWLGMGALGGWMAAWLYIALLGFIVWRRWANGRWQAAWAASAKES